MEPHWLPKSAPEAPEACWAPGRPQEGAENGVRDLGNALVGRLERELGGPFGRKEEGG